MGFSSFGKRTALLPCLCLSLSSSLLGSPHLFEKALLSPLHLALQVAELAHPPPYGSAYAPLDLFSYPDSRSAKYEAFISKTRSLRPVPSHTFHPLFLFYTQQPLPPHHCKLMSSSPTEQIPSTTTLHPHRSIPAFPTYSFGAARASNISESLDRATFSILRRRVGIEAIRRPSLFNAQTRSFVSCFAGAGAALTDIGRLQDPKHSTD